MSFKEYNGKVRINTIAGQLKYQEHVGYFVRSSHLMLMCADTEQVQLYNDIDEEDKKHISDPIMESVYQAYAIFTYLGNEIKETKEFFVVGTKTDTLCDYVPEHDMFNDYDLKAAKKYLEDSNILNLISRIFEKDFVLNNLEELTYNIYRKRTGAFKPKKNIKDLEDRITNLLKARNWQIEKKQRKEEFLKEVYELDPNLEKKLKLHPKEMKELSQILVKDSFFSLSNNNDKLMNYFAKHISGDEDSNIKLYDKIDFIIFNFINKSKKASESYDEFQKNFSKELIQSYKNKRIDLNKQLKIIDRVKSDLEKWPTVIRAKNKMPKLKGIIYSSKPLKEDGKIVHRLDFDNVYFESCESIKRLKMQNKRFKIGIIGEATSGKTTLRQIIVDELEEGSYTETKDVDFWSGNTNDYFTLRD